LCKAAKRALVLQAASAIDPSLAVPLHLIEQVGDGSKEGSWVGRQPAPAAVHWGEEY